MELSSRGSPTPEMSTWLDAEWAIERRRFSPCRDDEVMSCKTEYVQGKTLPSSKPVETHPYNLTALGM